MKKLLILFLGVLLTGCGADSSSEAGTENDMIPVSIPCGRYYLDGNRESERYIIVTESSIEIVSPDLVGDVADSYIGWCYDEVTAQTIAYNSTLEYIGIREYIARYMPQLDITGIFIEWDDSADSFSGSGYTYKDTGTIIVGFYEGEFILAEHTADSTSPYFLSQQDALIAERH